MKGENRFEDHQRGCDDPFLASLYSQQEITCELSLPLIVACDRLGEKAQKDVGVKKAHHPGYRLEVSSPATSSATPCSNVSRSSRMASVVLGAIDPKPRRIFEGTRRNLTSSPS